MNQSLEDVRRNKHTELNGGSYDIENGRRISSAFEMFVDSSTPVSLDKPVDGDASRRFIHLNGRIILFRKSGKIAFIKIADSTGEIQLIATKASSEGYDKLNLLDLGDIIHVYGVTCLSKTNEQSVLVLEYKLLTKATLPPPEKFHGVNDQETKYRQRYLDLMSDPSARKTFQDRSKIVSSIRNFLTKRDFIEVETPVFHPISGGATAQPFTTHHNSLDQDFFLRIAPELYLKKLLVGGMDRVFEIGKNFRNEGLSSRHNPEFTMLEFYQAYVTLNVALHDFVDMLSEVCRGFSPSFNTENYVYISMEEAVQDAIKKGRNSEGNLLEQFERIAEPYLVEDYRSEDGSQSLPVFVTEYPVEFCPLARPSDSNPKVCDRFELFIEGMEIANGYQELNDPVAQEAIFKAQVEGSDKEIDQDYITALKHGMPPAVGIGVGIDRLVMLLTNSKSIKDVILFPTLKNK